MRYITLIAREDEYDTTLGIAIKGVSDFDGFMADRDGTVIAHDLLEHQNGASNMGPVWDELEACGAVWQVRGRWGDMCNPRPNIHSPEINLASDVTRMFPEWINDHLHNGPGGLSIGSRPHEDDETFLGICDIARRDIPAEYGDDYAADIKQHLDEYLTLALHRMRSGYRKANKRFGDRFAGINLFKAIQEAVADAMRDVAYEGQLFHLAYGNGDATCTEIYDYD